MKSKFGDWLQSLRFSCACFGRRIFYIFIPLFYNTAPPICISCGAVNLLYRKNIFKGDRHIMKKTSKYLALIWILTFTFTFSACNPHTSDSSPKKRVSIETTSDNIVKTTPTPEATPTPEIEPTPEPITAAEPTLVVPTPQSITVYRTNYGECYHTQGCTYLRKSCIEITLNYAKQIGLRPCSRCCPPQ